MGVGTPGASASPARMPAQLPSGVRVPIHLSLT